MNLSSRLTLFFAPVLIAGYLLIAFATYSSQRAIAIAQAQSQLEVLIDQVHSELDEHKTALASILKDLPKSEEILAPSGDPELLDQRIRESLAGYGKNLSFGILSSNGDVIFRYPHLVENKLAPTNDSHHSLLKNGKKSDWYVDIDATPSSLSMSIEDRLSYKNFGEDSLEPVEIQLVTALESLASGWKRIQETYKTNLSVENSPIALQQGKLVVSREIDTGEYLNILVGDDYIDELLTPLYRNHVIGFLLLFTVTLLMLTFVIRRYIGKPLKVLATDLSALYEGKIKELAGSDRSDEIGVLTNRFISLHQELTDTYEQSRILAEYDSLTSLPNRASFYNHAEETLRSAALYHQEIRLLYIDLDNYKQVNDKFGHDMGDELLVDFSRRLSRVLHNRFTDDEFFAARLAGDEFAVILPPNVKKPEIDKVCKDILKLFDGGYWFARGRFAVTLSIGIATYPNDGKNINELVSNADLAMYQAKKAGKNRTAHYSQDLAAQSRYLDDLERELRRANFDEEFHLVYMPIFDANDNVVSAEALVRWSSPQLGDVSPSDFVPVAETCGLFLQLDRWVLRTAFSDFRRLRRCFGKDFRLSINLSSAELQSHDVLDYIKEQFSVHGIQPSSIELEMTETFAISQHLIDGGLLYKLAELGVHISLDDFGTGFTSMLQLVEYPIERIKLDRTFISRIMTSERKNMLPALVDLCHAQNLQVTAEGIENQQIADAALAANCDALQGYHLCKPQRLEDLEEMYKIRTVRSSAR